jgi:hypothetical protein
MAKVSTIPMVSIKECINIIKLVGANLTPMIMSEPGVGKSSILEALRVELGEDEYDFIYLDCPNKEIMDIAASIPNHATKALEYYVSSLFKLGNGKKKVIMLDEMLKAPKMLQVLFTRMILEHMIGDEKLPDGSILFATSNNATDGVGDTMAGHVANRLMLVRMRKPSASEWNTWASANGINRVVRAWVAMYGAKVMASYIDGDQEDNPYIFKPSSMVKQFASPRSLARASYIVDQADALGENATMCALAGTIGEAAARDMAAFLSLQHKVSDVADIIKHPLTTPCPNEDVAALLLIMFQAIDKINEHDELSKFMEYVERINSSEVQSIFFTMMMRAKTKLARHNDKIKAWAKDNYELMA